jgi:hypothetical protein
MRRFPAGTPSLPLVCGDPSCACAAPIDLDESEGLEVTISERRYGWFARVIDEGRVIDLFHTSSLSELLEDVHRAYPRAHFDPEE